MMQKQLFTLFLCRSCTLKVVDDAQDYQRVMVTPKGYASGECQICYGVVKNDVRITDVHLDWLINFTFKGKMNELANATKTKPIRDPEIPELLTIISTRKTNKGKR